MALALRGPTWPLPGMGNEGLHGLGRPYDAVGSVADPPHGGAHFVIASKFQRVPLNLPAGPLVVVEYDAGDIVRAKNVGGHPGAVALWLADYAEVDEVDPPFNTTTLDPLDYVVP